MRRLIPCLLALLLTAAPLSATEKKPAEPYVPNVVQSEVAKPAPSPEASMHLSEIEVGERPAARDAAPAQLGPRGSFWWVVGVIVVAGVILAVLL